MSEKIAYEKHPISAERVKELNAQGFKVLDERFKPTEEKPKTTRQAKNEVKE